MSGKKIMIFDDDDGIVEFCKFYFADKGYVVESVGNCHSILEKVNGFDPDLILMDCWIPPNGGSAAVQILKENNCASPIIMFSANRNLKQIAEKAGADGYLEKPFELNDLDKLLNNYL